MYVSILYWCFFCSQNTNTWVSQPKWHHLKISFSSSGKGKKCDFFFFPQNSPEDSDACGVLMLERTTGLIQIPHSLIKASRLKCPSQWSHSRAVMENAGILAPFSYLSHDQGCCAPQGITAFSAPPPPWYFIWQSLYFNWSSSFIYGLLLSCHIWI